MPLPIVATVVAAAAASLLIVRRALSRSRAAAGAPGSQAPTPPVRANDGTARSKEEPSFLSLMKELAELQKQTDDMAKNHVKYVRTLTDMVSTEAPTDRAAFEGRDLSYYDRGAAELARLGFRPLGAVEGTKRDKAIAERSFADVMLSADGTVVSQCFEIARRDKPPLQSITLRTWVPDEGLVVTTRNSTPNHLPSPPGFSVEILPAETSTETVVRRHAERVRAAGGAARSFTTLDEILAAGTLTSERASAYRRGLGMGIFEPYFRSRYGEKFEEQGRELLEAILAHPEWYREPEAGAAPEQARAQDGVNPTADGSAAVPPARGGAIGSGEPQAPPMNFFSSSGGDGRRLVTTFGMMFAGFPELQMPGLAANHVRAARFLMTTVGSTLLRRRTQRPDEHGAFIEALERGDDVTLTVTPDDVPRKQLFLMKGEYPEPGASAGEVTIRLTLAPLSPDDPETKLLRIDPLPGSAPADERLRDACRLLGQFAPDPLPFEWFDDTMRAASARARAQLPAFRERIAGGLGEGEQAVVKLGLPARDGGREYVWMRVEQWSADDTIIGPLLTPSKGEKLAAGTEMTVGERDVFDYALLGPDGFEIVARTDIVAQEFGADV